MASVPLLDYTQNFKGENMKIVFHARHAQLAADFREIAEEKLHTMERFSVTIERVEVEILHELNPRQGKHSHRVVLTSHGAGPLMRAEAAEFNDVAAFDAAIKNFELQIRKHHERSKSHNRETLRNQPIAVNE
jgi:ribosomal subunit interface protein